MITFSEGPVRDDVHMPSDWDMLIQSAQEDKKKAYLTWRFKETPCPLPHGTDPLRRQRGHQGGFPNGPVLMLLSRRLSAARICRMLPLCLRPSGVLIGKPLEDASHSPASHFSASLSCRPAYPGDRKGRRTCFLNMFRRRRGCGPLQRTAVDTLPFYPF